MLIFRGDTFGITLSGTLPRLVLRLLVRPTIA